jgi:acetoin:2,6-dichlorophenolindophenol oxidoreductase subunit beta
MSAAPTNYCEAILRGFEHLLDHHEEVFVIGQGLWSPWYVGNSMKDLDRKYGTDRILDTPVSEDGTTGIGVGASLCGDRPIVVHPRMDFMILAVNSMVNQAAKWSHMLGGRAHPSVTIRGIINRGGEQGAQHSQALHSWFAHIPGLRVVMPATATDARDLLISSVLCDDPVLYIDDRWCYDDAARLAPIVERPLQKEGPRVLRPGKDITLVGAGFSALLCRSAAEELSKDGIDAEVIDVRVVNPLDHTPIAESVRRTRRLLAVDGGWSTCGLAGEIIAGAVERLSPSTFLSSPRRITLPDAPAPTSKPLEKLYYPTVSTVTDAVRAQMG